MSKGDDDEYIFRIMMEAKHMKRAYERQMYEANEAMRAFSRMTAHDDEEDDNPVRNEIY